MQFNRQRLLIRMMLRQDWHGEFVNFFENLIHLQAALNALDIKYRLTSIATRIIGVRGKSLPGSHP